VINFFKITSRLAIGIIVLVLVFLFSTLWYFSIDLPDYKILANYKPPISSRVHAGDGQLIAEYALQKRLFIPYGSIPKNVINSFLSAEDKNFFSHPGVDAKSITRAVLKNLKKLSMLFSQKLMLITMVCLIWVNGLCSVPKWLKVLKLNMVDLTL